MGLSPDRYGGFCPEHCSFLCRGKLAGQAGVGELQAPTKSKRGRVGLAGFPGAAGSGGPKCLCRAGDAAMVCAKRPAGSLTRNCSSKTDGFIRKIALSRIRRPEQFCSRGRGELDHWIAGNNPSERFHRVAMVRFKKCEDRSAPLDEAGAWAIGPRSCRFHPHGEKTG